MRLAVIADIHGNVAALQAVLADVKTRGADRIINLGDCVSGPVWPGRAPTGPARWQRGTRVSLPGLPLICRLPAIFPAEQRATG